MKACSGGEEFVAVGTAKVLRVSMVVLHVLLVLMQQGERRVAFKTLVRFPMHVGFEVVEEG